jgi:dCMP deaminase
MHKWDARFFNLAREIACWSKDPDCRVGAVLVSPDRRQFSVGYNGLPQGLDDDARDLKNKELKNSLTIHAELNAILNTPVSVRGWTMYTTKSPCTKCALAIIQAGIGRVVTPGLAEDSSWKDDQMRAVELLIESPVVHCVPF